LVRGHELIERSRTCQYQQYTVCHLAPDDPCDECNDRHGWKTQLSTVSHDVGSTRASNAPKWTSISINVAPTIRNGIASLKKSLLLIHIFIDTLRRDGICNRGNSMDRHVLSLGNEWSIMDSISIFSSGELARRLYVPSEHNIVLSGASRGRFDRIHITKTAGPHETSKNLLFWISSVEVLVPFRE